MKTQSNPSSQRDVMIPLLQERLWYDQTPHFAGFAGNTLSSEGVASGVASVFQRYRPATSPHPLSVDARGKPAAFCRSVSNAVLSEVSLTPVRRQPSAIWTSAPALPRPLWISTAKGLLKSGSTIGLPTTHRRLVAPSGHLPFCSGCVQKSASPTLNTTCGA